VIYLIDLCVSPLWIGDSRDSAFSCGCRWISAEKADGSPACREHLCEASRKNAAANADYPALSPALKDSSKA